MADEKFVGTPKKATTHVNQNEDLIFEKSSPGKKAYRLSELDVPAVDAASLLGDAVRTDLGVMPELSEIEIVRHFTRLSTWNYAIDLGMFPLGSCTMKYNGRVNEVVARLEGIAEAHPYQPESLSQGVLEVMKVLIRAGAALEEGVGLSNGPGTPLVVAARNGQIEAARVLIEAGADVNAGLRIYDGWKATPLAAAVASGHIEMIKLLEASKARLSDNNDGGPPALLRVAIDANQLDALRYLIARRYMIRLARNDFADPGELESLARVAGLSPEAFRREFEYVTADEPAPQRLLPE